jgi:hypothetical protein
MSTTIGKIETEGYSYHSIEVYIGVEHVVLFVQNSNDRDGIGTKILLSEEGYYELSMFLKLAGEAKGWNGVE